VEDFTAQDEANIAVYLNMSTDDLMTSIEALHLVKKGELFDPYAFTELYTVKQVDATISLIRDIVMKRNAIN